MSRNNIIPIQFAQNFDNNVRRIKIDGVWYFSILDMFKFYGQSSNPNRDWKRTQVKLARQGFDVVPNVVQRQFEDSEGRLNRPTPCVNFNTLLRIAQVTDFKQWEYLRQYMADIAEDRIMNAAGLRGKDQDPVLRAKSKEKRKYYTDAIDETLYNLFDRKKLGSHIAGLTNVTYEHLLGAFRNELVKRYGFTKTESKKFRDQFGNLTLSAISYIEESAGFEMYAKERGLSPAEQKKIVREIAKDIADVFHRQCTRMNVDWLTNKPLLPGPDTVA